MTTSRTYRALIVANSTFPDDPGLVDLEGPRNDPGLLRDALSDAHVGLIPNDNVRLVIERTMAEVLQEIERFLADGTRDDTLILYYSGHGKLNHRNELFLCTRDTQSAFLKSTAIKASAVREMIDDSAASATVILLDCCHSGRFKSGGDMSSDLAGRGTFVLASSRAGELANDTDVPNRASFFTHLLVEGIRHGANDQDGDGIVTLNDIYDFVYGAVLDAGNRYPVPQKKFHGDGHVALAKRSESAAEDHEELLDPAHEEPILDVTVPRIDLGEVEPDEAIPPERVSVVNRGGGTLNWTFDDSQADWVQAERDGNELVLHVRPRIGDRYAAVYVRDTRLDLVKTVRISVHVRDRVDPVPSPVPPKRRTGFVLTAVLSIVAAAVLLISSFGVRAIPHEVGYTPNGGFPDTPDEHSLVANWMIAWAVLLVVVGVIMWRISRVKQVHTTD